MSDGITDAAKMTAEAVRKFQLQYLKDIPTCYLVDELCRRDDVTNYYETFTNFRHHILVVKEE